MVFTAPLSFSKKTISDACIILFSRFKEESGSFQFLGFEFRWGKSHKGKDIIKRKTSRKKLKKSIKNFVQWCKKIRNKRFKSIFKKLNSKLHRMDTNTVLILRIGECNIMKKNINDLLMIILVTVIFSIGIIIPTMIIPVSSQIVSKITQDMQNNIFGLMLLVSLFGAISLFIIVKYSQQSGINLMLALGMSFWGIEYFMAQIETFYFREAFTFMTNQEIINMLLRGLITTITVVTISVIIFGKRKTKMKTNIKNVYKKIEIKNWVKKAVLFAILYIIIYQFFGYYIAWQFEAVRVFYSGTSEKLSFINQLLYILNETPSFLPYHFVRGLLWVIFSIPIILIMAGSKKKTIISLILLFSYHGFQIIMAQGIFPTDVLIGHTIETTISASIYGGLIGYMFYIPNRLVEYE